MGSAPIIDVQRRARGIQLFASPANISGIPAGHNIPMRPINGSIGVLDCNEGMLSLYIATAGGSLIATLDEAGLDQLLNDIRDTHNAMRAAAEGGGSG